LAGKLTGVVVYSPEHLSALGWRSALETSPFQLLNVANDFEEFAGIILTSSPPIAVADLSYEAGPERLKRLRASAPDTQFVALVPQVTIANAAQFQEANVAGLLRRDATINTLIACLERVARGQRWVDLEIESSVVGSRRARLTKREVELIRLVLAGQTNREIGVSLTITEGTVKVYLSKLFRKVDVRDRLELAMYGMQTLGLPARTPAHRAEA
jgi:DNA-binding NarL/FixJ family response regulator